MYQNNYREDRIYVNEPDPKSNYFASENDRFGSKEYAIQEKMNRERQILRKTRIYEQKIIKNQQKN